MHQPLQSEFGASSAGHPAPQQIRTHAALAHHTAAGILMVPLDPFFSMDAFPACRAPPPSPSAAAGPSTHHGPAPALSDLSTHLETLAQGPGLLSPLYPSAHPRELSFTMNGPTRKRGRPGTDGGASFSMMSDEEGGEEAVSRLVKVPRPAAGGAPRPPSAPCPEHSHGSNLPSPGDSMGGEWEQEAPERRWNVPFVPFDFHQRAMDHEE